MGGGGICASSTSSCVPAPPSLAATGSVSALVGPQARGGRQHEVELRNLHLMEPEDGGTEAGYEEDDEDDGEEGEGMEGDAGERGRAAPRTSPAEGEEGDGKRASWRLDWSNRGHAAHLRSPRPSGPRRRTAFVHSPEGGGGGGGHGQEEEERRRPGWARELSLRRGLSTSSMRSVPSLASLEELMGRGSTNP